MAMHVLREK